MNALSRVKHAMRGEAVDRVPVGFYTHFADQRDNTVSDQVSWTLACAMDYICIETDGYMQYPSDTPLATPADWGRIRPHQKTSHYIAGQVDRAKRIADALGERAASFYMIYTPYSTIKHTLGGETLVNEFYRADPASIEHAMRVIEEDNALVIDELRQTGLTGLFVSMQNAERWRFTPEEYREKMTPWDMRVIAHANQAFDDNIIHLCSWGCEPNNIEVWQDYDYKTVNWGVHIEDDLSLSQGRKFFKPGTTIMGGFDVRPEKLIITGTEQEIKSYTKQLIDEAGQTAFMISGDCSLQEETPSEHIRWVVEATQEYAEGHR